MRGRLATDRNQYSALSLGCAWLRILGRSEASGVQCRRPILAVLNRDHVVSVQTPVWVRSIESGTEVNGRSSTGSADSAPQTVLNGRSHRPKASSQGERAASDVKFVLFLWKRTRCRYREYNPGSGSGVLDQLPVWGAWYASILF
jgi:hypothetical protein